MKAGGILLVLLSCGQGRAQTIREYFSQERLKYVVVRGHPDLPLSVKTNRLYYEHGAGFPQATAVPKQEYYRRVLAWARTVTPADKVHTTPLPNGVTRVEVSVTDPFQYQVQDTRVATHMTYSVTMGIMDGAYWSYSTNFRLVNTQLPEGDPHKYTPLESYLLPSQNSDQDPAVVQAVRAAFYEGLGVAGLLHETMDTTFLPATAPIGTTKQVRPASAKHQ